MFSQLLLFAGLAELITEPIKGAGVRGVWNRGPEGLAFLEITLINGLFVDMNGNQCQ